MVQINQAVLDELCAKHDVEVLKLFGSVARDEADDSSDVDLLVRFQSPRSLPELVRIEREFSERLGRSVDLVTEGSLSPHLKDRVLANAVVVYERAG